MQGQILSRLNPEWVRQARGYFKEFLEETGFPNPVRNGARGSEFRYPEWLIMFIAVISVRCKVKTYQGMHRLADPLVFIHPSPPLFWLCRKKQREIQVLFFLFRRPLP